MEKCVGCGSTFVVPRPTVAFISDFYYQNGHNGNFTFPHQVLDAERKYPNSTIDAKRIIQLIKSVQQSEGGRFLDVGAGYGLFSREAQQQNYDVTCVEVGAFERACIEEFTGVKAVPVMFEAFEAPDNTFDVVLMSQILEHVIEPQIWLEKAYQLLAPAGVLCIAVPNFKSLFRYILRENDPYIIPPEHLNYFTSKGLLILLERVGFQIITVQYNSRLPFASRFPREGFVKNMLGVFEARFCQTLDALNLGMFLNLYARKV
ncbi:MAG: class I SAM-dependent methyltransferase [Ardenticatenaceae bacterium]|nr:class I SAM-dependent methyltransferase [Ardenticatenaceae bacterium]